MLKRLQIVSSTREFRLSMTPLHPISRGILETTHPLSSKSRANRSYLAVFLSKAALKEVAESQGTVSSRSTTLGGVTVLSMVTRSGICSVITKSGGTVPPFTLHPLMSAKICAPSCSFLLMVLSRWVRTESTPSNPSNQRHHHQYHQ